MARMRIYERPDEWGGYRLSQEQLELLEKWHRRSQEFRKLNLSSRTLHALVRDTEVVGGLDELVAIALYDPKRLLSVRGLGTKGLAEIQAGAHAYHAQRTVDPLALYLQQFYTTE